MEKLPVGDYSVQFIDGYIPPIYFERKSLVDLFGTLGKGYKRFKKEIVRAQEQKLTLILIVETSLGKVAKGCDHSTIDGISIVKKLFTLWIRHGIQVVFCQDKEEMAEYITQFYLACGREHIENAI